MIKIRTEKIVGINGELYRKFKQFSMLPQSRLPRKYLAGSKNVCMGGPDSIYIQGFTACGWKSHVYEVGDRISEERFQELLVHIRRCGNRLMKINRKLAKLRKEWSGEETFVI